MERKTIDNVMMFKVKKENRDYFVKTYEQMFDIGNDGRCSFDEFMFNLTRFDKENKNDIHTMYLDYSTRHGICGNIVKDSKGKPITMFIKVKNTLCDESGEFDIFDLKEDECVISLTAKTLLNAFNPKELLTNNNFGLIEEITVASNCTNVDNIKEGAVINFKPEHCVSLVIIDEAENKGSIVPDKQTVETRLFYTLFANVNLIEPNIVLNFINHEICSDRRYYKDHYRLSDFVDIYFSDRYDNIDISYIKYDKEQTNYSVMDKLRTVYSVDGQTTITNEVMVGDFARFLGLQNMDSVLRGFELAIKNKKYSAFIY